MCIWVTDSCLHSEPAVLGNVLVYIYFKYGSVETACQAFHLVPVYIIFCWNSVFVGLVLNGYGEHATEAFLEMDRGRKINPDRFTIFGLLSAWSHADFVSEGKK